MTMKRKQTQQVQKVFKKMFCFLISK